MGSIFVFVNGAWKGHFPSLNAWFAFSSFDKEKATTLLGCAAAFIMSNTQVQSITIIIIEFRVQLGVKLRHRGQWHRLSKQD